MMNDIRGTYPKKSFTVINYAIGDRVYYPDYKYTRCRNGTYKDKCEKCCVSCSCNKGCDSVKEPYIYYGTIKRIIVEKSCIFVQVDFDNKFKNSDTEYIVGETIFTSIKEAKKKQNNV